MPPNQENNTLNTPSSESIQPPDPSPQHPTPQDTNNSTAPIGEPRVSQTPSQNSNPIYPVPKTGFVSSSTISQSGPKSE